MRSTGNQHLSICEYPISLTLSYTPYIPIIFLYNATALWSPLLEIENWWASSFTVT
ncbi:hypothetical protein LIPSTDRAFT_251329 [Lipomyces starkeyi NRRL Y-11557]|uniref:Uncharacterized protein n=1 Tax=Lipomyces starkeyi NRRL Y-11557 TaxID=675824 RepID=A0A1E3Q9G7_LIPST|nr:hypothetical protein LIPSTDRAFT_251329 [Lipomyces starkeyi NRRL Y-11557]